MPEPKFKISPSVFQEVIEALEKDPLPPLSWFEERLPGVTDRVKVRINDVAVQMKQILNQPDDSTT